MLFKKNKLEKDKEFATQTVNRKDCTGFILIAITNNSLSYSMSCISDTDVAALRLGAETIHRELGETYKTRFSNLLMKSNEKNMKEKQTYMG